jgi:hypothetical protein
LDQQVAYEFERILASTIGSYAAAEFRIMPGAALNAGVTPIEAKE